MALAGGAAAQTPNAAPTPQPQAAPLRLTLRDAVNLALKQNPNVILANLEVARSEEERLAARAGLLPQGGAGVTEVDQRLNVQALLGQPFPGIPEHAGPFQTFAAGVNFQAAVFDLTLWRRYRSAKIGVDASRAGETAAREESVLLVVSQYLGGQRAAANVQSVQSQVDLAQALYDQASDLQSHGVG
ncbi:MAG TPA: TolC family protein, partial [Bryobacteraceae bacterium]|nr:TolC family protein [Bryobacteraceae bacterium]